MINRTISIAPMMDWTDRHFRYLLRLISSQVLLYTEMVTTGALIHGHKERFLAYNQQEHPLALQLGGNDPQQLAQCAVMAQDYGYDEINLNVGCPSDRVQNGAFGACLMAEPQLVADCVAAMLEAVSIPVTVKTRIGIDDLDSYEFLTAFIEQVAQAGCEVFIIHARKAWLQGLSPKQNREVPPLSYDTVYDLHRDFPQLTFIINGGINTLDDIDNQLAHLPGVMIGRAAYHNPFLLSGVDQRYYGEANAQVSAKDILQQYLEYVSEQLKQGVYLKHMSRHLLGLFQGLPGARAWRRYISENACKPTAGIDVLRHAMDLVHCD